ncbi:MAG: DUF4163 domain-containing protein [Myxococcota bacterium]|nr:DUF4163 domain-containing protein [Myxococcota bacterium]
MRVNATVFVVLGSLASPFDCPPLALPAKTDRRELPPRGKYDARISYLYVTSSDTIVDHEINGAIASDLAELRRAFIKSADLAIAESKRDPEPLTRKRVGFDITCDKAGSTTTMLSIVCKRYTYLGGPYPNVDHITYNLAFAPADMRWLLHLVRFADRMRSARRQSST